MDVNNRYYCVIEIIKRMQDGKTGAWLCQSEDDEKVVVKVIEELPPFELVAEWVAGHLGIAFGLPVPPIKIIWGMQKLLPYQQVVVTRPEIETSFGSTYVPNTSELQFEASKHIDAKLKSDILIFDVWVKNGDRTLSELGGNVNLLHDFMSDSIVVFDHNQAFSNDKTDAEIVESHVFSGKNKGLDLHDLISKVEYEDRLAACIQKLDEIVAAMPTEWRDEANQALADGRDVIEDIIRPILNRYTDENFWGGIRP